MAFKYLKVNLYKLFLVSRNQPQVNLSNWEPFMQVMDDDFAKNSEFTFSHPHDSQKPFIRRYVFQAANGNTFVMFGEMKHKQDSACVAIVVNSVNYGFSYLALYDNEHVDHSDVLAESLVRGFNKKLKDHGVEMTHEFWSIKAEDARWADDFLLTYTENYHQTEGKHVTKMGVEDLTAHDKKTKARNKKRRENNYAKAEPKKTKIEDYILDDYKDKAKQIMVFLRDALKGRKGPRSVSMPFRLLLDKKITSHIPYSIINKEMKGQIDRVSSSKYYKWTNKVLTNYDDDRDYNELNWKLDSIIAKRTRTTKGGILMVRPS